MLGVFAFLPSAGIGLLCGSIAEATGRVWLGALLGAILSAGIFGLFVLPVASCFSFLEPEKWLAEFTWIYFAQKGAAGAIGGALGGFVGGLLDAKAMNRNLIIDPKAEENA